jgi:cephalosporin hydroxylase
LKTTFAKVAGYKIKHNKYKNTIAFWYKKQVAERNQKNNPIHNTVKNINYIGVNQTKEVQDIFYKNYEMLMKWKKISKDEKTSHDHGSIFYN